MGAARRAVFGGVAWQSRQSLEAIALRCQFHLQQNAQVKTSAEWVYNGANLESQRVVWARYLTDRENANLSRYFTGRTVWLLDVTVAAKPRLYRYAPATMRSLPFPAPRVISPEVAAKVSAGLPTKPPDKSGVAALPVREQILYHKQVRERSRMRLILGEPVLPMP